MQTCSSTNGFARRRPPANPLTAALEAAYDKAFSAIFDANATTLITAVILFWQATGSVKGFAVTLTLGIIASMFSALLVTRTAFRWAHRKVRIEEALNARSDPEEEVRLPRQTLDRRHSLSIAMIGGSIIIFAIRGEKNFGIDFRGGDLLVVDSKQPVTVRRGPSGARGHRLG